MGHVRKDTLTTPGEYAKHLRPRLKRTVAKAERQAAKKEIAKIEPDDKNFRPNRKSPMEKIKKHKITLMQRIGLTGCKTLENLNGCYPNLYLYFWKLQWYPGDYKDETK